MSDASTAPPDLRVAAGQLTSTRDVDENLARIARATREAARLGSDLVVFPEASTYAWQASAAEMAAHVRSDADRVLERLSGIAAREGVGVVAGVFTSGEADRPRNTMVVLGADGALRASYDKVHLYDSFGYRESDKVLAGVPDPSGAELAVVDLGPFTIGLLNCYDLRFPEFTRALVDAGADTFVISSAWVSGTYKADHWETLLRARAIENTSYAVAASQPGPDSVGLSMIVDPLGQPVAALGTEAGLIHADLSADRLREVRDLVPSLQHRKYRVVAGSRDAQEGEAR